MSRYRNFFFLLCLALPPALRSQEIPFRKLTVEDGLANSVVYRIYQDAKGYLWFSTDYGLSKYDGFEFKNFYRSGGLSSNYIMSVTEDSAETKWISCYAGGIASLDKNGTISTLPNSPLEPIYMESVPGRTWVLDSKGSIRYFSPGENILYELVLSQDSTEYAIF